MDAAKVMAAAFYYDGDPWDMIGHGQENWVIPMRALPVITVPTLAAAGSEMNHGAVISNDESKVKSFVQADCLFPKVALEGVDKFEEFLRSIGCPTRLSEVGIGDELLSQYAEDAALVLCDEDGCLLGRPPMSKEDIIEVLRSAL